MWALCMMQLLGKKRGVLGEGGGGAYVDSREAEEETDAHFVCDA